MSAKKLRDLVAGDVVNLAGGGAAILDAERNEPQITGVPIHAPGLGQAVSRFLKETE